jgi:hypothetical protein
MEINFDHKESIVKFFCICFLTVLAGLTIGGFIDAAIRKLQKDGEWETRKYSKALTYFFLQSLLNIAVLLTLAKTFPHFVSWLQLSVSGALFSVLLFAGQRNLFDNALKVTNF